MIKVFSELDPQSRAIVKYLIPRCHASLHELTSAAGLQNHMETLKRIREIINPLARRLAGKELLTLKRAATDPLTGETVTYHWWLGMAPGSLVEICESDGEVLISLTAADTGSFSGSAEAWVTDKNAVVRILKGGLSRGDQD
jgi:hypothetical protein